MKKLAALLLITLAAYPSFSQNFIRAADAVKHNGETVSFVGFVTNAQYLTKKKNAPMIISIGEENTPALINLVIRSQDHHHFKIASEKAYLDQYVYVKGRIEMHKGKPEIVLRNNKQIAIVSDLPLRE